MTTTQKALVTNDAAMFVYGVSAVLIGPTLPGMISDFDLTLGAAGLIGSLQSLGGLMGALAALFIADRVSRPIATIVLFALSGASLVGIGLSTGYALLLVAFAVSGLWTRLFDVMVNAHTGTLVRGDSGRGMSTLHMFFSVGAFVGPIAARALMRGGLSWTHVFVIAGGCSIATVVVSVPWLRSYVRTGAGPRGTGRRTAADVAAAEDAASTARDGEPRSAHTGQRAPQGARTAIALLSAALFFYAIHQIGVTAWLPYYLETSRGIDPDIASLGLSLYWIGIIGGRFGASRTARRVGARRLLGIGALVSAAATFVSIATASPAVALGFAAIAGVSSGATIPLAYSVAFGYRPDRTGAVTAVMSIVMLAGRFVGPWAMGAVADATTLGHAMAIPAAVLIVVAALAALPVRSA